MSENNKTFDAYFHGRMSAKQAIDFQTALEANSQLKSDYEFYLSVKKATLEINRDNLRSQLDNIDLGKLKEGQVDAGPKAKNSNTKLFSLLKSAVAIAALFVIGFWGYQAAQPTDMEDVFAQNFETYLTKQSRGENESTLAKIYNEGNYEQFILQANEIEHTPEIDLMLANVYLVTNQEKLAISTLERISDESSFRDQKYWYLGLANLKEENIIEAKKHFNHLLSLSNYKKKEITKILSALNK